jgi:cell division protein FtsQ
MHIMASIKKIFSIVLWCATGGTALALLVAAINKKNESLCKGLEIQINADNKGFFLDKKDVVRLLEKEGLKDITDKKLQRLNLHKVEDALAKQPWIKDVQLYFDNNQVLKVKITERQPIARIFTVSGSSYYMDSSGKQLPLTDPVPLKLPVFTGYPAEKMGLQKDSALDQQIKQLSAFLHRDTFWSNAIEQVNITPSKTFEMIPLIGNQVIVFGDGNRYEDKFRRLLVFYKQVMTRTGFEKYAGVNVEYAGQVIGTRRGGPVSRADSLQAIRNVLQIIRMDRKMGVDTGKIREVKPLESSQITEQNLKSYDFPEENENGGDEKNKH